MMNDALHLFTDDETMIFVASVLIQASLVIVLALLSGHWLRHQPVLRHSVLVGGLICVLACPLARSLANLIDAPLVSIAWPVPDSAPTELSSTSREAANVSERTADESLPARWPSEAVGTHASTDLGGDHKELTAGEVSSAAAPSPESIAALPLSPEMLELASVPRQSAREHIIGATEPVLPVSGSEITHSSVWENVAGIAGLIWLVGLAVIAIRLLLAWRYLSYLRLSASALDTQSLAEFRKMSEEVLQAVTAKQLPPLLVSDELKGPISLGLFRPAIILPAEMIQALSASQLRDVLIHEMAHIHRHDHVVVLLQRLASAFFWPFPLVRLLNAKIDQAREDVCDNYVLRHSEASQYSRMLLELTERASLPQAIPLAIGLWKCRRKLEQRVTSLLDPRRKTRTQLPRRTLCTVAVAFMSLVMLLAGSRITPTSHAKAAKPEQPADELQQPSADEAKLLANDEEKKDATKEAEPAADKDQSDPYNTLYDVLMTRWKDGKPYAQNETSPAIFSWSEFPFDDTTFEKFNAAMDAFAALPHEKIDDYSDVKRALLQRHLWKVFDTTFNWNWSGDWYWGGRKAFPKSHMARRTALQPKIASLIRRLALTKEQILALPNPMAATIKSGQFAETHDPADRFKPFLPADLYTEDSSWICLGEDRNDIPASQHTGKLYSRSIFLQFMRLPEGRTETLEYMERTRKRPHQFPVGTQFALIEQPFLISKEGKLVLSPMIVSVQLRAYLNVGRRFSSSEDDPQITQSVAEFVMEPRQLMKGDAVMTALGPNDFRYEAGSPFAAGFSPKDPFATGDISEGMPTTTRLNLCMSCHGSAGGRGVRTASFRGTNSFKEATVEEISKATSAQKQDYKDWKLLKNLWQDKSPPTIDEATLTALLKPAAHATPDKPVEEKSVRFTKDPTLRAALIDRIETEIASELKTLHTAILLAEVAKLSEMFRLEETETNKLRDAARGAADRAVEKTRDTLKAAVNKSSFQTLNGSDVDMSAFTINGRYIRFADAPKVLESIKKTKVKNGSYIDAETGHWVDTNINVKVQRRAGNISIYIGFYGYQVSKAGPRDSDVQNEESWKQAISGVLTKEQLEQYSAYSRGKFKSTLVDMLLTALQFDLDLADSQLPIVRQRFEERISPDPTKASAIAFRMESTVGGILQRAKAEDLADILTKEELNRFPEHPESRIKSTLVTLILAVLKFDLHLSDSQLPAVRERLEQRISPGSLTRSIESTALRTRWTLKVEDFADILTEPQQTLWRLTQGE